MTDEAYKELRDAVLALTQKYGVAAFVFAFETQEAGDQRRFGISSDGSQSDVAFISARAYAIAREQLEDALGDAIRDARSRVRR